MYRCCTIAVLDHLYDISDLSLGPLCRCYCTIDHTHSNITTRTCRDCWAASGSTGGATHDTPPSSPFKAKNGQLTVVDCSQVCCGVLGARTSPRQLWPRTLRLRVVILRSQKHLVPSESGEPGGEVRGWSSQRDNLSPHIHKQLC